MLNASRYVVEGKSRWAGMLRYVADLHAKSTHEACPPFDYAWEEIGPGYCYGPAFGHWDIVHQMLDVVAWDREHVRRQLLNNLKNLQPDGFLPGSIWMRKEPMPWHRGEGRDEKGYRWNTATHPPVWPAAVDSLLCAGEPVGEWFTTARNAAAKQIEWFRLHRSAQPKGFFYTDILDRKWESGVDEGIRFDDSPRGPYACVDATSHVYMLAESLARWNDMAGADAGVARQCAEEIRRFVTDELYSRETGFFHDRWSVDDPGRRLLAQEGMWPVVAGIASESQADSVIEGNLVHGKRFFTKHPLATVAVNDPRFELRMWRGPAWNSMTLWAVLGCIRYGHFEAGRKLSEAALDASAEQFERTGTVWEFYHPHGGRPESLERKPQGEFHSPCRDYLGHNPLLALGRVFVRLADGVRCGDGNPYGSVA